MTREEVRRAWVVRPETRCLEGPIEDRELARIAERHAAYGSKLFRRVNRRYWEELADVPLLPPDDLLACAKLEHELDHIQKSCSTSYGFLIHRLHSLRAGCFFERIRSAGPGDNLGFPLFAPRIEPNSTKRTPTAELAIERQFHASGFALRVLECASTSPRVPLEWQCEAALDLLAEQIGGFRYGEAEPARAFPVVELLERDGERRAQKVGGTALLEYPAVSRELTVASYADLASGADIHQLQSRVHRQAAGLWKLWAKLPMPSHERVERGWANTHLKPGPRFPAELLGAIDVALWLPFEPEGWTPNPNGWSWEDIHPGFRYLRILEFLRTVTRKYLIFAGDVAGLDEWLSSFQTEVCGEFGWPTPTQLADSWLAFWERQVIDRRASPLFIGDDWDRVHTCIDLLSTRHRSPALSVLSYPGASGLARHWFQAVTAWDTDDSSKPRLSMRSLEGQEEKWAHLGYRFPPAFVVSKAVEIFGTEQWVAGLPPGPFQEELRSYRRALEQDIQNYARRNHDLRLEFGGRVPRTG